MFLRGKTAITGMGELKPTLDPGSVSSLDLMSQAAAAAIRDAGLKKQDIDGLLMTPSTGDSPFMWPSQVAEYLGMAPDYLNVVELGGASAAGTVLRAAVAVAAGLCRHCLCLSGGVWDSQVFNTREGKLAVMSQAEIEYELPCGPMGFNSGYAMVARRHMTQYGTTAEQLAKLAVDQRTNALANPYALYNKKAITIADVLGSPMIVDPLHLLEIVRPCSGAAAVIVSAEEATVDLARPPIWLLGMGEAYTHNTVVYAPDLTDSPVKKAAGKAFAMSGLKPADMGMIFPYDCYPITVLITLEDAGFCGKGESGSFVEGTDLTWRGDLPCNTHGGQLSFGQPSYAGGMSHVTEAVRQLRGEAGERQVIGRNTLAYVNGNGGVLSTECSLILGRER